MPCTLSEVAFALEDPSSAACSVALVQHSSTTQLVTPCFPNNVNNTNNQSIQRKMECHTTFKI